ncbi:hypothetical protein COCVIDRAFT_99474 [Bipolaris victoriae FI3]|uniref:Uncharacterized protein n=1 Tax=Bipolaris victoriae (strain FI3) TaxID=930091 RepID=W7EJF5_BIPV3|nr:hypothetical protein COCVIDRAFT_99474 [Bipolaris victoriae FI3]
MIPPLNPTVSNHTITNHENIPSVYLSAITIVLHVKSTFNQSQSPQAAHTRSRISQPSGISRPTNAF